MKNIKIWLTRSLQTSLVLSILTVTQVTTASSEEIATLRKDTAIDTQKKPSEMSRVLNHDIKQSRNYPMQPPVIPHKVRNYEVNLNTNKCMSCHSRQRTEESQAPMVSVTHYMDRDGNFLAEVSPRRYFCSQCHVPQMDANPLVENTFEDMHSLMQKKVNK